MVLRKWRNFGWRICFGIVLFADHPVQAWDVDLSRRVEFTKITDQNRLNSDFASESTQRLLSRAMDSVEPSQDVVIINTGNGFIPEVIRLKKNANYRFHVVNVNVKEKNVSFIMDAFSEHHNTFFGIEKSFSISPKVDGIFSYQCPETAIQGKIVVLPDGPTDKLGVGVVSGRKAASE